MKALWNKMKQYLSGDPDNSTAPAMPAAGSSALDIKIEKFGQCLARSWQDFRLRNTKRTRLSRFVICASLIIIIIIIALLSIAYLWIAIDILYKLVCLTRSPADSSTEDLRNLLLGLAALIGAPFLVWRTWIADRQLDISRERHYTDLFTTGAKNLGAVIEKTQEPDRAARIGAIYALERVAQDSQRDHWPIMETLTAFVRENAPVKKETQDNDSLEAIFRPIVDIQAALTVIGRRSKKNIGDEKEHNYYLDLQQISAPHINLRQAHLEGAHFGRAHLKQAIFRETHLKRTIFMDAHLEQAYFWGAHLEQAIFQRAHLEGADFQGAHLEGADFQKADLSTARNLTQQQIEAAFGDATTKLPADLSHPDHWLKEALSTDKALLAHHDWLKSR